MRVHISGIRRQSTDSIDGVGAPGKKVSINAKGTGSAITGPVIFRRLGIDARLEYEDSNIAIERMRRGDLAAIFGLWQNWRNQSRRSKAMACTCWRSRSKNSPIFIALGVAVDECASAAILVKPGSTVRSLADLKGKCIASQSGTITHSVVVHRLLPSAKLTASDVQFVNLRFQDTVSALVAGSVDAVAAVDPFLSSAEQNGAGIVITDFCRAGPVPLILAASAGFAQNTDLVRRFIKTWQQAEKLFPSEPDRVAQIYADSLKARGYDLPQNVVIDIVRHLNVKPDTVLFSPRFLAYVHEEAKFMQQEGQLSHPLGLVAAFPEQPIN